MANNSNIMITKTFNGSNDCVAMNGENLQVRLQSVQENIQKIMDNQTKIEEKIQKAQDENATAQSKILAALNQLVNKNVKVRNTTEFPVKSIEDLEELNLKISQNMDEYVNTIQTMCSIGGLYKNFGRLFSNEVVLNSNYDGINNKKSFKMLQALNMAMFEAVKKEGYTESDYIKELRSCFKAYKGRYFRKVCVEKQKQRGNLS